MAGVELVQDWHNRNYPLRVWRRQARGRKAARIRVKCGCCDELVDIFPTDYVTGDPSLNLLEINGVMGTVDQWRKVFGPLLKVKAQD